MINRFPGLTDDVRIEPGTGTVDDVIVRSFDEHAEKAVEVNETTTKGESPATPATSPIEKRSILESVVLSRKGVYRVLESRLSA
jgi:hypothetical protein